MTARNLTKMATAALKTAVAKVMEDRRQAGRTVPVWKDGRVQRVKPVTPKGKRDRCIEAVFAQSRERGRRRGRDERREASACLNPSHINWMRSPDWIGS